MQLRHAVIGGAASLVLVSLASLVCLACGEVLAGNPGSTDVDASASDVTTPQVDGEAADAGTFCSTKDASLCWSFDDPPYIPGDRLTLEAATGTITTTKVDPKSPPFSLDVTLTTSAAGVGFAGVLHQQAPTSTHVTCSFDVRVEAVGTTEVAIFQLSGNGSKTGTRISILPDGTFNLVVVDSTAATPQPIGTFPINNNKWLNVSLEVDATNLAAKAFVEQTSQSVIFNADASVPLNHMYMGAAPPGQPSPWRLAYDNLFCTGF